MSIYVTGDIHGTPFPRLNLEMFPDQKCGAQISKSTQTGKWECGACGETWEGELP